MKLRTDTFDLWIFSRQPDEPRYLLFHTSQEKADRWFGGGGFWQTPPGGLIEDNESLQHAINRIVGGLNLTLRAVWAAEYSYTIWNRRRSGLEMLPVFAAEVEEAKEVPMTWEASQQGWFTARECEERLFFRGHKESLKYIREYVSEVQEPAAMLRVL
ncbi:MAG: hypothetical protein EHM61_05375 [Acidobacteria bacterium]|nr:MAG: hypothetical protein EHM61_05375 [Acidobacteriota bacterium]